MEYSKKGNLQNHINDHKTGEINVETQIEEKDRGEYPCDHCDKIFRSSREIKRHLRRISIITKKINSKKKPHVCEICLKGEQHKFKDLPSLFEIFQ